MRPAHSNKDRSVDLSDLRGLGVHVLRVMMMDGGNLILNVAGSTWLHYAR
jgi:hypothetical protein